jgi:NADPH-dependent glutamate synthase beta subunit-like oxidoreductase
MRYGIPSYRLPKEVIEGEIGRLSDMGIEFIMDGKVGKDLSWESIDRDFDAVFVAIGAYKEARLRIEGLDRKGVFNALDFLRESNLGRRPNIGKRVAIIGGGNSALDCARVSRRFGAEVTIVYRRTEAEMPAHPEDIEMAREEGVEFMFLSSPVAIYRQAHSAVIKLAKMTLGEPDVSGRRRPMPTDETEDFECETVILAIGESCKVEDLPPTLRCVGNAVKTDAMGRTDASKWFAGGDIVDIPHTVTHAIGSGKQAAVAIDNFFLETETGVAASEPLRWGETGNICISGLDNPSLFPRRNPNSVAVAYRDLNPFYFDRRPGMTEHILSAEKRSNGFDEVVGSPTEDEIIYEAARCFNCGSCTECGNCFLYCPDCSINKDPGGYGYIVDLDYCKGCGICVHECPRGAMKMEFIE